MTNQQDKKPIFRILVTFLFVYIVLFEFVLPTNNILPKPSLLFESIVSLWQDYGIFVPGTTTISIVYSSLILGYICLMLLSYVMIWLMIEMPGLFNAPRIFKYFLPFFFILLFVFWFQGSIIAEIAWAILYVFGSLCMILYKTIPSVGNDYIDFARSLSIPKNKIFSNVVWKFCQPKIFKSLIQIHFQLWVLIFIYEYTSISNLGNIFRLVILYKDFGSLIVLGIIISIVVFLGNSIIRYLNKKIIFWE